MATDAMNWLSDLPIVGSLAAFARDFELSAEMREQGKLFSGQSLRPIQSALYQPQQVNVTVTVQDGKVKDLVKAEVNDNNQRNISSMMPYALGKQN